MASYIINDHWIHTMSDVYFLSEPKKSQKKSLQVWRIRDLFSKAGKTVTFHLLFIHVWTGSDTSYICNFGHGKANLLKKIQVSEVVQQIAHLMGDFSVIPEKLAGQVYVYFLFFLLVRMVIL